MNQSFLCKKHSLWSNTGYCHVCYEEAEKKGRIGKDTDGTEYYEIEIRKKK